jgi:hypothetical protein
MNTESVGEQTRTLTLAVEMADWIMERERVRMRHDMGEPKPWSEDRIMRTTRFTNVRREDDRVTKWVAENWRDEFWNNPNLVPALVIARMVNRPETLERIGFPENWNEWWEEHFLKTMKESWRDEPLWGTA